MNFVSLTRLRIRSIRYLPFFAIHTFRSLRQVRKAHGFQTGALLNDRSWTFWTMTVWDGQESMRRFMSAGSNSARRFPLGFVLLNALLFPLDHTDAGQGEVKVFVTVIDQMPSLKTRNQTMSLPGAPSFASLAKQVRPVRRERL